MAVPFNTNEEQRQRAVQEHYIRIENLLMELLSMLRWTPWYSMIHALENALEPQPTIDEFLAANRRLIEHFQRVNTAQQERSPLPDVVPTNNAPDLIQTAQRGESAAAAGVNVPGPSITFFETSSLGPIPVIAVPVPAPTAAARGPDADAQAPAMVYIPIPIILSVGKNPVVMFRVEITQNSERRFKLVLIRNKTESPLVVHPSSTFSGLITGFLKAVNISVFTAAFVVIGMKIFAKK